MNELVTNYKNIESNNQGTLNFVTCNSDTYRSKFIAKYLIPKYIRFTDEFYLFTTQDIYDFDYYHITNTFYEWDDIVWLLNKLKVNPYKNKSKLIIIDGLQFGLRPYKNNVLDDIIKFFYCDLKKFNTNIIIGTLLIFEHNLFNIYDQIDNIYLSSKHFSSNINMYYKFTKNTFDIKKFSQLIKFNGDNKFLSIRNIQTPNIKLKQIEFKIDWNTHIKINKHVQTNIYIREKFKSEFHLVLGYIPYDNSLFGIKFIYNKIKDNFDNVFVYTDYPKFYKSIFKNKQIYTQKKYYIRCKSNVLKRKLKYHLIDRLKDDIIYINNNFINNLLIIDIKDLEKIFNKKNDSDTKNNILTYLDSNEVDEIKQDEIKQNHQMIKFLIENHYKYNITIIVLTRRYIHLDITHLYMGYESDKDILFDNYNKIGFNYYFGYDVFKTINLELDSGKYIYKYINRYKRNNIIDMIKIVNIEYVNKLIKPKIHLLVGDSSDKQIFFIKKKLLPKINNFITNTWILVPEENQHYWSELEDNFFILTQIDLLVKKIISQTKINQLLIIDYNSDTNKKLIGNKDFVNLLKKYNEYNLTIIWSVKILNDDNFDSLVNLLSYIHYYYLYLDQIILNSVIKSTSKSLDTSLFDLDFYKLLNFTNFNDQYIIIKYKKRLL